MTGWDSYSCMKAALIAAGFSYVPPDDIRALGRIATFWRDDAALCLTTDPLFVHESGGFGRVWVGDRSSPYPDSVTLSLLFVRASSRRRGLAGDAMRVLTRLADQNGVTVLLEAAPQTLRRGEGRAITRNQLIRFYERFGFKSDLRCVSLMRRVPCDRTSKDGAT